VIPLQKERLNPNSSEFDRMIEFKWIHSVIQSSATVLAFTSWKEQVVSIAIIDLKTRRKSIVKTFRIGGKPTCLYQLDENNLLVGTDGGKVEHWVVDESICKDIYDAHPESFSGVSQIIGIKSTSHLLRGKHDSMGDFKLIATASFGTPYFCFWKVHAKTGMLMQYFKVTTSLSGITCLLETQDTQLVASNAN
jgi:hypothetical protein